MAKPRVWTGGDTSAHLRAIQVFHRGPERGWVDIACHFLLDRDGTVFVGRPEEAAPDTATAYDPAGHLSVCPLGNFDAQPGGTAQLDGLVQVVAWLLERYQLPLEMVRGHRDFVATACPGRSLYRGLADGSLVA